MTRAVLFDVAGTLAMPEDRARWLLRGAGLRDPALAARLEAVGRPGGPYPADVPEEVAVAYAARDTSPAAHRAGYVGLLATACDRAVAEGLYARILVADGWVAYADAAPVLGALRERGLRVGAVSNVGFDLRPVLDGLGLLALLEAVVLSYEVGAVKPDPRIFRAACAALAVAPEDTLMVGDHAEADGGAAAVGMRTLILPMTPPGSVHGLRAVLDALRGGRR
jgi:HAD superfamily hydrolase (TIGR01549 family)